MLAILQAAGWPIWLLLIASIVALARKQGFADGEVGGAVVPFTAQTRMSGLDLPDGTNIRKGAASAVLAWLEEVNGEPLDTQLSTELSTISAPMPSQFLLILPYIATIVAVAGLVGKVRAPASDGTPYIKE